MNIPGRTEGALARPAKAKFATTGIGAGVIAGMAFGLVVEMAGHPSMIFMQIGGIVGFATGALVESVRYWWRKHRYQRSQT